MKLKYTCLLYLLLISFSSLSQQPKRGNTSHTGSSAGSNLASNSQISGVWRGFFTSGSGFFQEKYKYEVQIGQLTNNGIKGVTYSYKTTVFYGKANLAGMYTPSTKNLVIKENKLVEVKMSGGEACLMTCYLEYTKVGNTEILEGTFTSINIDNSRDCGSGRVYLEKVPESDFYKEDFVKEYENRKKNPPVAKTTIVPKATPPAPKINKPPTNPKKDPVVTKPKTKETTTTPYKSTPKKEDVVKIGTPPLNQEHNNDHEVVKEEVKRVEEPKKPLARELRERENTVAKIIQAEGDYIQIDIYDNGQIDDDTVTVYHNKQVVAFKKRLCHQPITIKIKVDPNHPRNEFTMVADNLGSIPPNTALMVITVGKQRHDVFLTSSLQKNAVVIVDCKVPSRESK